MKSDHHLVFLTRQGCSGSEKMMVNLNGALAKLKGWTYEVLDLDDLPKTDPRRGYPTPTILRSGKDIYGLVPTGTDSPG